MTSHIDFDTDDTEATDGSVSGNCLTHGVPLHSGVCVACEAGKGLPYA